MASARLISASTPDPSGCGWKVGVGERGACTLLGPEGPDAAVGGVRFLLGSICCRPWVGGWVGCRPYFENYTVDASIFAR